MFTLMNKQSSKPERVVILGASGFVGTYLESSLKEKGVVVKGISSREVNLVENSSPEKLKNLLNSTDTVVFAATIAPCKDYQQLAQNIEMANHVCQALLSKPVKHIVYISSDAVYPDGEHQINETTLAAPDSLHGVMHLAREIMLKSTLKTTPIAVLRLSLLYGTGDPHNGYGPNRFIRNVESKEDIRLFGGGEEKRDHIYIEDIADLICRVIEQEGVGTLNIATGHSISFLEVAETIRSLSGSQVEIKKTERQNPITHRHFDITSLCKIFPDFYFNSLSEGVNLIYNQKEKIHYG